MQSWYRSITWWYRERELVHQNWRPEPWEDPISLPFPAPRGLSHFWAPAPSPIFKVSEVASLWPFLSAVSPSLILLSPSPTCKDPCDYSGSTQNIRDHLPPLKVLNFVTSAKSLLPRQVTDAQVPGIRSWTSLGDNVSAYHTAQLKSGNGETILKRFWKAASP